MSVIHIMRLTEKPVLTADECGCCGRPISTMEASHCRALGGWMDEWTDGSMDGWTDRRTDGRPYAQIPPVSYRTSSPLGPLPKEET